MALPDLAALATLEGDAARALRLAGAASTLEENAGIWAGVPPIKARHEHWLPDAQQALDEEASGAAWAEGRRLTIDQAIEYALEEAPAITPENSPAAAVKGSLSGREREILSLVAEGRSNREMAGVLIVSEHTAKYHVTALLNKLGAASRAEAGTRAVALGLLSPTSDRSTPPPTTGDRLLPTHPGSFPAPP